MEPFTKYRLDLQYDGTQFHGWQRQSSVRTVQAELEQAAENLFPDAPSVHGASRTDSGVHALGQVVHFRSRKERSPGHVVSALNDYLPDDVTVLDAAVADPDFQAHVDATGKTYAYVLMNRREPPALLRKYMYWHPGPLESTPMKEAIQQFRGTHNFRGFATNADEEKNPRCRIADTELLEVPPVYLFAVTGDRFLYNMVRCMVGTLVMIGKGNASPSLVSSLLDSRDRSEAGPVIAAEGLYLKKVFYDPLDGGDAGGFSLKEEMRSMLGPAGII